MEREGAAAAAAPSPDHEGHRLTVTQNDEAAAETEEPARVDRTGLVWRVASILAVCVVGGILLSRTFDFLRDTEANRLLVVAVAIVVGVGGVFFLFWAMNQVVDWMPAPVPARASGPTSSSARRS